MSIGQLNGGGASGASAIQSSAANPQDAPAVQVVPHPGPRVEAHAHRDGQPQARRSVRLTHDQRVENYAARARAGLMYHEPASIPSRAVIDLASSDAHTQGMIRPYQDGTIELEIFDMSGDDFDLSEFHMIPADQCPRLARALGCTLEQLPEVLGNHQRTIEALIDAVTQLVETLPPYCAHT